MKFKIKEFLSNPASRLIVFLLFVVVLFSILVAKLFQLQIVEGSYYNAYFNEKSIRTIEVAAPRGSIYDRNGIPLATNESSYSVYLDPSITVEDLNKTIFETITLLESNNDDYVDNFPMTTTEPFEFTFTSDSAEARWKEDMTLVLSNGEADMDMTASEAFEELCDRFDVDDVYTNEEARKILPLRSEVYQKRFSTYLPIIVAYDVSEESLVEIEEKDDVYAGIYVEKAMERVYPYGEYVSNIIGYTGSINTDELEEFESLGYDDYSQNDIVGKTKMEKAMEEYLRGESGSQRVEVTYTGRRQNVVEIEPAKAADSVYLTIDINLQKEVYELIEDTLTQIQVGMLNTGTVSSKELLLSLVESNNLPIKKVFEQPEGTVSYNVKNTILGMDPEANVDSSDARTNAQNDMEDLIENDMISTSEIMAMLSETGVISLDEDTYNGLRSGSINVKSLIMDKMNAREITPGMTRLDPYSASIAVEDVNTGEVLAAVSYPSYDNNKLVNNIDNEYYSQILVDPSQPMLDRAFMDAKSPGSTFKMITAIAGLEEGVITPTSTIYDGTTFTKAGVPYASCWSHYHSHGNIDAAGALQVSCNYFFYEVSYRLGNASNDETYSGIEKLNNYMIDFGLNDRTGVEIGEHADVYADDQMIISSPEYKEFNVNLWYDEPTKSQLNWYDGDTIRTAIGQSENYYTPASMVKYISTLANGGTRYESQLVNQIKDDNGNMVLDKEPVIEKELEYADSTWQEVYDGMYLVTHGPSGTGRSVYSTYPINVMGKTGTVQGSTTRNNHSTFASFAPMENPEIAVYTIIPNGDTSILSSAASKTTKKVYDIYFDMNEDTDNSDNNFNTLTK